MISSKIQDRSVDKSKKNTDALPCQHNGWKGEKQVPICRVGAWTETSVSCL